MGSPDGRYIVAQPLDQQKLLLLDNDLPPGMRFDVLMVPGLEHLSTFLHSKPVEQKRKEEEKELFFLD